MTASAAAPSQDIIWATGRRKTSVARVRLLPGGGKLVINSKSLDDYFGGHDRQKLEILQALKMTQPYATKDIVIHVHGGGVTGQAQAIRHGISRAFAQLDEKLKKELRKEGFLTRDDRMVERKKPGRPKARKRYQYSKR